MFYLELSCTKLIINLNINLFSHCGSRCPCECEWKQRWCPTTEAEDGTISCSFSSTHVGFIGKHNAYYYMIMLLVIKSGVRKV